MSDQIKPDTWVWVFVQDPEKNQEILGQRDEENDISFVPMFLSKEDALQCLNFLKRQPGRKCEAQAILYEELVRYTAENQFVIFLTDGGGLVKERIAPQREDA